MHHQDSHHENGGKPVPVTFEFTHPTATTVCVAGTFNDWHPHAKPMHALGNGLWRKETVLPLGTHEYCLVVDGRWLPDPKAKEWVANPFGGRNSILKVVSPAEGTPIADSNISPSNNTIRKSTKKT